MTAQPTLSDADRRALDYLARLGAQPAIAFHEDGVATAVRRILTEIGVSWRTDTFGNIIARLPGRAAADSDPTDPAAVPPIAFMAHLDHPGFEVTGRDGDYLIGQAAGGVPPGAFAAAVPLQIILPAGRRLPAATAGPHGNADARAVLIRLLDDDPGDIPVPSPAVFDLPDFRADDDYLVMRAADDLAGCGSILAALDRLRDAPPAGDVYGVFTRAEEVGLVGARLLAESGALPPDTLVVSLESSRTLPGAEIGAGPVIRTGDAGSTFNYDAESALIRAREILSAQSDGDGFQCQRQLMSGGVCEASAFLAYGYRATGMAFPLGNYHNGAPDGSIAAEYIHRDDYRHGAALITEAARQVAQRGDTAFRRRIRQVPDRMRARLGG